MQKPVIYIAALLFVLVACGKDKFNTKPSITIKSITPTTVPIGGQLQITFEYTDKEGDISDSIFLKKTRINQFVVPVSPIDTFGFALPDFPGKSKGEIQLTLSYFLHLTSALNPPTSGSPPVPEPDTLVFRFALRDEGGNISDTVQTDPIVIIR